MNKLISIFALLLSLNNFTSDNGKTLKAVPRAVSPSEFMLQNKHKRDTPKTLRKAALQNALNNLSGQSAEKVIERITG